MRVNQSQTNSAQNAEASRTKGAQKAKATEQSGVESAKAKASTSIPAGTTEISGKAKEMAQVKSAANSAPDVREGRIAELKRRIASGEYQVDAQKVSDRMVDDHLKTGIG